MKYFYCIIILIFVVVSTYAQTNEPENKNIFKVNAEIKEIKNRTLECKVRNHTVIVDQPLEFGADNKGPTPPEMLAISYGSCIASTIQFLAYIKKIVITDVHINVYGEIDFSKAMGKNDNIRAGFAGLKIKISFKSNMTDEEKQSFIKEVMDKGAAIDNVNNSTPIEIEIEKQ